MLGGGADVTWDLDLTGVPIPAPAIRRRFFLAHSKAADEDELEMLVKAASAILDRFANGKPFDLVLGRTYFEARFTACGSWEGWTTEIAVGVDFVTRRPLFDAIMVPAAPVGAGTAAMVKKALGVGKPVIAFTIEGKHAPVVSIKQTDRGNWQGGHRLICARPLAS